MNRRRLEGRFAQQVDQEAIKFICELKLVTVVILCRRRAHRGYRRGDVGIPFEGARHTVVVRRLLLVTRRRKAVARQPECAAMVGLERQDGEALLDGRARIAREKQLGEMEPKADVVG